MESDNVFKLASNALQVSGMNTCTSVCPIQPDSDKMFLHHQEANGDYTRYEHISSWLRSI